MATSVLSQFNAPSIDGQAVKRVLAPAIMENIVQDIILRDGYGVTEKFSTDTDAFEIRVVRENALTQEARNFGATVNGGFFNATDQEEPTSTEYGLRLTYVIDQNIDIASNMMEMFPLDVVGAVTRRLGQLVAKNINASTMAEQIAKSLVYSYGLADDDWHEVTLGTTNLLQSVLNASAQLDNGDTDNGVDIFPEDQRVLVWRPTVRPYLMSSGGVILGGSNFAQQMIATGKLDPVTKAPRENMGGYFGDIDNVPNHIASNPIWTLAESYLGLTAGALDGVYGMMVSGIGTARALAFNNTVKTIDSPRGQGMRLQPKYRWGVETWFPKSVRLFVVTGFTNPADALTGSLAPVAPASQA